MGLFSWRRRSESSRFKRYRRFPRYDGPESIAPKHPLRDSPRTDPDAHAPEPPRLGPQAHSSIYDRWHAQYEPDQPRYRPPRPWFEDVPRPSSQTLGGPPGPHDNLQPDPRVEEAEPEYIPMDPELMERVIQELQDPDGRFARIPREHAVQILQVLVEHGIEPDPEELPFWGLTDLMKQKDVDPGNVSEITQAGFTQQEPGPGPVTGELALDDLQPEAQQMIAEIFEQGFQQDTEPQMAHDMAGQADMFSEMQAAHDQQMEMSLEERVSQEEMLEQQGMEALPEDPFEEQRRMYDEMQQMMDPFMMPGPYGPGPGP